MQLFEVVIQNWPVLQDLMVMPNHLSENNKIRIGTQPETKLCHWIRAAGRFLYGYQFYFLNTGIEQGKKSEDSKIKAAGRKWKKES